MPYSTTTSFTGGPPANQTSLVFTGNGALYTASGLTETNGKITFGSPFAAGSMSTVPLPPTVDVELTQP